MKRSLIIAFVCCMGEILFAQQNTVVMRINGKEVSRSEFELSYQRDCTDKSLKLTPKEYAELFSIFKLKVAAAEVAHLDTAQTFQKKMSDYQFQLSRSYLIDECNLDSCANSLFNQKKLFTQTEQVQIRQIVKYLPQNISNRQLHVEEKRMDSIYQIVKNQPGIGFSVWVDQFSDDRQCIWMGRLETLSEMEKIVFDLYKGEISSPFVTPEGIHIVQIVDRREALPFEQVREEWKSRFINRQEADSGFGTTVEHLKKTYGYVPDSDGIEELIAQGTTEQTLFVLNGQSYTGAMFKRFAESRPQAINRQLNTFIVKSVLDCAYQNPTQVYPDQKLSFQMYRDLCLVTEINRQKIELPATTDKTGLMTYFKFHKSVYRWDTPRFKGAVLHCLDKATVKQVKRLLKKTAENAWVEVVNKTFNQSEKQRVQIEQGIFAEGDNKYIDKLVFKKGNYEPIKSHSFTVTLGKKVKGPDEYKEVFERVQKDYKDYLTACWIKDLKAKSKVEINQEVLKTVNNH